MTIEEKILLAKQIDKLERDLNTKNIEYKMGYQSVLFDVMELINKLPIHVVSKCDCDKHIACIVCGEEKGLDGDFWKRMKEQ